MMVSKTKSKVQSKERSKDSSDIRLTISEWDEEQRAMRDEQREKFAKRREKRDAQKAKQKLQLFGEYISLVQGDSYTKSARAAMLWSAIPLFYILGGLVVESSTTSSFWGLSLSGIDHENILVFLLVVNLYYTIRFSFWVVKSFCLYNPFLVFWHVYRDKVPYEVGMWATLNYRYPTRSKWVKKIRKYVGDIKNEDEVRNFLVHRPIMGFLENVLGRLVAPVLLCGWALYEIMNA